MRKYSFLWLILLSFQLRAGDFDGVKALAERRTPWLKQQIVFEKLNVPGKDVFELQTRNGKLVISATGPNAAAAGLNWYLKYYCNRSLSHMGDNLSPVSPLPVIKTALRQEASAQYRYALNYCTYNY